MTDEQHRTVDLALVVQAVDVASHAGEQPAKMRPCDSPWLAKCVSSLLANTAQRLVTVTASRLERASSTASSRLRPRREQRPSTVSPVPAEQRSLAS